MFNRHNLILQRSLCDSQTHCWGWCMGSGLLIHFFPMQAIPSNPYDLKHDLMGYFEEDVIAPYLTWQVV